MTEGLRTMNAAEYHSDPCDQPSLSASIAKILCADTPAHARIAHPRLNANYQPKREDKFVLGTVAHALFLEGDSGVTVVPLDSWRSNEAKECRDAAYADGRVPMLAKHYDECVAMVKSLREQCDSHAEGPFFRDGLPEQTLVWEDDYGVICRARLDWLLNDHSAIHDLKTTKVPGGASHEAWSRTLFGIGAHLQYVFYLRGAAKVLGVEPDFRFYVVETVPPFASAVHALAPDAIALANKQIDHALKTWAMCLRNDHWPAYEQRVAYADAPPWIENAWLSRELREVEAA